MDALHECSAYHLILTTVQRNITILIKLVYLFEVDKNNEDFDTFFALPYAP